MSLLLALTGSPPASVSIAALEFDDEFIQFMRKNVAGQNIEGQINDRTTGAPLTASVTVYVTGDNGTQTAGAGTTTHKGNGAWNYAPTQAETNFNHIAFTFVHASGVVKTYNVFTYSYDPQNTTSLGLTNLDAAITSRMATYTQPTGFLAATFPTGTIANTTNITAGTVTTATNVTTVNGLAANVITAASIAAAALNGKGDWNIGKTGYSLTQAFPTNFSSLAITVGGAVTAGTVSDKTGYSLTQSFPANFSSLAITVGGAVTAGTVSDKTGYSLTQAFPTNFSAMSITAGGIVESDIKYVNGVQVTGTGVVGNEWGPV